MTADSARFRQVLGHLPTGVTVVTARDGGEPVGLSCNSFTSVSLDPPLVSFCPAKESETWPRIEPLGRFAVNVLSHDQHDLGRVFARKGVDRFDGVAWRESPLGNPWIEGALAWVDCELHARHEAGDHWIVLGLVRSLEAAGKRGPLVFFRGSFHGFQELASENRIL